MNEIPSSPDYLSDYQRELDKLDDVFRSSEQRWEERVYQIAAGGLSLCFAAFSFLAGTVEGFTVNWMACTIMVVYALVILINFLSQRLSVHNAKELKEYINDLMKENEAYNAVNLKKTYDEKNRRVIIVYWLESILLIADVACTVWFLWAAL